jgi:hypothetical protein
MSLQPFEIVILFKDSDGGRFARQHFVIGKAEIGSHIAGLTPLRV